MTLEVGIGFDVGVEILEDFVTVDASFFFVPADILSSVVGCTFRAVFFRFGLGVLLFFAEELFASLSTCGISFRLS